MTITITLAGQTHEIRPLNLGEVESIADALTAPAVPGAHTFQRSLDIICRALKATGKDTPDVLRQTAITPAEMRAAQEAILEHSGLVRAAAQT